METNTPKTPKQEYSSASVLIAIMLGITFVVLLQFFTNDMIKTFVGERPEFNAYDPSGKYNYKGRMYENYSNAFAVYQEEDLLNYEMRALVLRSGIIIPLFIVALVLAYTLGKQKLSYKLATNTFFAAMSFNMLLLLFNLAEYIYKVNQRIAIYAISIVLIVVFVSAIIYIQEKKAKNEIQPQA